MVDSTKIQEGALWAMGIQCVESNLQVNFFREFTVPLLRSLHPYL